MTLVKLGRGEPIENLIEFPPHALTLNLHILLPLKGNALGTFSDIRLLPHGSYGKLIKLISPGGCGGISSPPPPGSSATGIFQ